MEAKTKTTMDLADRIDQLESPEASLPEQLAASYAATLERYPMPDTDRLLKIAGEPAALAEYQLELSAHLARLEDEIARLEALIALEDARLQEIVARLRPLAEGNREKDKEAWILQHPDYKSAEVARRGHIYLLKRLKGRRATYHRVISAAVESLQTARALVKLGG